MSKLKTYLDIDRERQLINAVCELFRTAIHFKQTADEIRDGLKRITETRSYKQLPSYRRHAVMTVYHLLFHGPSDLGIYSHLEYRMLWTDGKYYASFDAWRAQWPDADASLIKQGEHFWKGTDKAFDRQEVRV